MKKSTAPIIWDLDSNGNVAPTVTPGATPQVVTFNLSGLEGFVGDLWAMIQAIWVHVTFTLTQSTGTALNPDKLWQAMDSFRLYSPVLGDVLSQRSNNGSVVGLIDQVVGCGYKFPTPARAQIASADGDTVVDLYYRIPLALDVLRRPGDSGIWAPLFEKGRLDCYIGATTAGLFQSGASIKAASATIKAWAEIMPTKQPVIHAPAKFVRYEFNTTGSTLKLNQFGNGDGLLGVNGGARVSFLAWLSSNIGLGGVDTIDKWSRVAIQWRKQRLTNNPDAYMANFLAGLGSRVAPVGSQAATTVNDGNGWPYTMAGPSLGSVLSSTGLFLPLIWPGRDSVLSGVQRQVGDLQIDAGFSSNPNGNHVFRTLEHYSWKADALLNLIKLYGFNPSTYTCEPKCEDNSDPRDIPTSQMWGVPLRIVERSKARRPVV